MAWKHKVFRVTEGDLCFLIEHGELNISKDATVEFIGKKRKTVCKDFRFKE